MTDSPAAARNWRLEIWSGSEFRVEAEDLTRIKQEKIKGLELFLRSESDKKGRGQIIRLNIRRLDFRMYFYKYPQSEVFKY